MSNLKLSDTDWVTVPATTVTHLSDLIAIDPEIRELGLKLGAGDTVFWSVKQAGAKVDENPITNGLLNLPINAHNANRITFFASVETKFTIIQETF